MNRMTFHMASASCAVGLSLSAVVEAQPVVEQMDRFELNWSTMRVRFYGEAVVDFAQKGFEGAEKVATDDGLMYALSALGTIRSQKGLKSPDASVIANELTKQAFVYNTIYFTDGRVRVELDGSLPKVLDTGVTEFAGEEPSAPPSDASAIQVSISGLKVPLLNMEIKSLDGELLYSARDVVRSAYKKQLSGRWFFKNSSELKAYLGAQPVVIEAVAEGDRTLVVTKESWAKLKAEHPRLIQEAKIAFVIPGPSKAGKSGSL